MHLNPEISSLLQSMNHASLPGIDLSLDRMVQLLDALGNPQNKLPPVIHLAGTNGKGSTQAFLRAMYEAAGYRVHAYTSPHLVKFNERMVLAGHEITDAQLLPLLQRVKQASASVPVTFFEATTAAAFLAFAEYNADVVLLETGLGGRLDATNMVAHPLATVITPVDFDHMEFLGDTIVKIAAEKAGIIKTGSVCITGAQAEEAARTIANSAAEKHAPIIAHGADWSFVSSASAIDVVCGDKTWSLPLPSLAGAHQHHNAALASVVAHVCRERLPITQQAISQGVANARWAGRLQRLTKGPLVDAWGARGEVYLDGGHNASAAQALAAWMAEHKKPITLVWGMMARKDAASFLNHFAAHVSHIISVPIVGEGNAHKPDALAAIAKAAGVDDAVACMDISQLPNYLTGEAKGTLLIAGSLFLAGEMLKNHA